MEKPSESALPGTRAALIVAVVAGVLFGGVTVYWYMGGGAQVCDDQFQLLNPRRRCEKDDPPKSQEYDKLMNTLLWKIDEWKAQGHVSYVSVHFRDLENSSLFGIQSQEHFAPASLLKVPIMMALLHHAEAHPEILDETVTVGDTVPDGANLTDPDETLVPRHTYTIREMLRRMIVYSDNSSKELLRRRLEVISPGIIDQTFVDLGISLQESDGSYFLTVKSYASLFRALFNASYMSRAMSQAALTLLTQTKFSDGIVAGVPKGTVVSHKFGYLDQRVQDQQLQDCGIVYAPQTPYLLCIMVRGKDTDTLSSTIAKISQAVFEEVTLRDQMQ